MKINDFMTSVQKYWGKYEEVVSTAVIRYLKVFREQTIAELLDLCVLKYPRVNKEGFPLPPPDVAQLNMLIDTAIIKAGKKDSKSVESKPESPEPVEDHSKEIDQLLEKFREEHHSEKTDKEKRLDARRALLAEQARKLGV